MCLLQHDDEGQLSSAFAAEMDKLPHVRYSRVMFKVLFVNFILFMYLVSRYRKEDLYSINIYHN